MCYDPNQHQYQSHNIWGFSLSVDEKVVLRDENTNLRNQIKQLNSRIDSLVKTDKEHAQERRHLLDFMTDIDSDLDIQPSVINTAITMIAELKADLVKAQADVKVLQNQKKA